MSLSPDKLTGPYVAYSNENITKKQLNKAVLAQKYQLPTPTKKLFVGIFAAHDDVSATELVSIAKHIPYLEVILLSLPGAKAWEDEKEQMLAGIDVFTFVSDLPKKEKAIAEIHRFGGVILAPNTWKEQEILTEYNPFSENGDSFFYQEPHPWTMMAELIRIHEVYKFPYDWNRIRRNAMQNT